MSQKKNPGLVPSILESIIYKINQENRRASLAAGGTVVGVCNSVVRWVLLVVILPFLLRLFSAVYPLLLIYHHP